MARNEEVHKKRQKVLELRAAGFTFDKIATEVGYANRSAARKAYEAALADTGVSPTPEKDRELELARLDALQRAVWDKARRGDLAAVEVVLKVSDRRLRLAAYSKDNTHELRAALEATVAASAEIDRALDGALIAAGYKIADRIDEAVSLNEGAGVTRALYLAPHFVNILRELRATPAARRNAANAAKGKGGSKLTQLRAVAGG